MHISVDGGRRILMIPETGFLDDFRSASGSTDYRTNGNADAVNQLATNFQMDSSIVQVTGMLGNLADADPSVQASSSRQKAPRQLIRPEPNDHSRRERLPCRETEVSLTANAEEAIEVYE